MNEAYHVIIVGGGPTGLVLANLLGLSGIRVAIVEKQQEVYTSPRATHIDAETLRNFQLTGLMDELLPYTSPFHPIDVIDGKGRLLVSEDPFAPNWFHGYEGSCFFYQPAFEHILRNGLRRFPHVTLLSGMEVKAIKQTDRMVAAVVIDGRANASYTLKAQWLIGADGGKSMVRANFNMGMELLAPARDWVIVDALLNEEADASLLPNHCRYIFEPERQVIYAHGFGRNRRWEFELKKGEAKPDDEQLKQWVGKYVSLTRISIIRIAKYTHLSLVASQWRNGRVFLAGDAAHLMPPSAGQGLCSGVRDSVNLAWKLAAVVKNEMPESILDSYEQERRPHLLHILKKTHAIIKKSQGDDFSQRYWRNIQLRIIHHLKPLKNYMQRIHYQDIPLKKGLLDETSLLAGTHLPQFDGSDNRLGYLPICLVRFGLLTNENRSQLTALGFKIMQQTHTDFSQWMEKQTCDFVLVRPDKIIFATGTISDLTKVIARIQKMTAIDRQALALQDA